MLRLAASCLVLLPFACATKPHFEGPLPVRNQHPAQLTVLHLDPVGASPLPAHRVRTRIDAAYTSYFLGGQSGLNSWAMDGELLRAAVKGAVGLGHGIEVSAELPVAHTTGGFLDDFLVDYHELFGFPDQGRAQAPRNRWNVRAERRGQTAYELRESRLELLDVPMAVTWAFLPVTAERPWGLAVRAGIEWPVGDEDRGFGNGEVDLALGMAAEYRLGPAAFTAQVQHTFAGDPGAAERAGLDWEDVTSVGGSAEVWLTDGFALMVRTEWETSVLRGLDFDRASDPQWLLWTGGRARLSERSHVEVTFGEDLTGFIAPDFTLYAGLALTFGGS